MRGALLFFKVIRQISRSHGSKNRRIWPKLGISGQQLQFEFTDGYEMLHKAWNSKGEMPYCFPRSSIKFQGHTGQNITDFYPNWAFPVYRLVAAFKSLRFALLVHKIMWWKLLHVFSKIHDSKIADLKTYFIEIKINTYHDACCNKNCISVMAKTNWTSQRWLICPQSQSDSVGV